MAFRKGKKIEITQIQSVVFVYASDVTAHTAHKTHKHRLFSFKLLSRARTDNPMNIARSFSIQLDNFFLEILGNRLKPIKKKLADKYLKDTKVPLN